MQITLEADPPPSVNRMTDRCKNITLPQTSFVDGKEVKQNDSIWALNYQQSAPVVKIN